MYWETNICVIHFPAMFALLWWSGAKHTVSLRHACTSISRDVLFLSTCHSLLLPKVSYTLGGPGGDSSQIWNRESEITPLCDRWVCWGLEKLGDLSEVRSPPAATTAPGPPYPDQCSWGRAPTLLTGSGRAAAPSQTVAATAASRKSFLPPTFVYLFFC